MMVAWRCLRAFPSSRAQLLSGPDPELGRPLLKPFRVLEQGPDLLVSELLALGLPLAAEHGPTLSRACRLTAPQERPTPGGRALAGW